MQLPTNSFDKISPTALMVAYVRQFTDIPYSQEISTLVNAQAVVESLIKNNSNRPVEIGVYIEGRYKIITKLIIQSQATQIIELASGLQPRGIVMTENPDILFIESDLPGILTQKQEIVQELIGNRPNYKFIPINVTSVPSQFPLHADYLNTQKPVVITCEGLMTYLTFAEKQLVFRNICGMLEIYGGMWITPDFNSKIEIENIIKISPSLQNFGQTVGNITGRNINDYLFQNLDHIKLFASEQGFEIESYSMIDILSELTCLKPLNIDLKIAKSMLANNFVFVLKLKDNNS
jgi:Leucine carboxyl methyltransferase